MTTLLMLAVVLSLLFSPATAVFAENAAAPDAGRVLVLDGSAVHDVGATHLNVTNWGLIGARPGTGAPSSSAPSLEFPVGSGADHLWAAGLWVGGIVDGVPLVSTGQYSPELLADPDDPLDTIYESGPGQNRGRRYPMPNADDDRDGQEDEDPLDGRDNDGDGLIDEDYAAVGKQYMRAVMRDDTPLATTLFPDHQPMGIEVVQESFQWTKDALEDFVGFRFTITNRGDSMIEQPFVGMFADFDMDSSSENDLPGLYDGAATAYDGSLVDLTLGYAYKAGATDGAFAGVVIAGPDLGASSFQHYSGNLPFDHGGDPTNDAERYESLSMNAFDPVPSPGGGGDDIRLLIAAGPFPDLGPGESISFDLALVVGETEDQLIQNAANAVRLANGQRFDRDGDLSTGIDGREFHVPWYESKGRKPGGRHSGLRFSANPNPFNPRAELQFVLPVSGATRIDVYDTRGRLVANVLDQVMAAGPGRVVWDGTDIASREVSSGVYFLRLRQGTLTETIRAVVVR